MLFWLPCLKAKRRAGRAKDGGWEKIEVSGKSFKGNLEANLPDCDVRLSAAELRYEAESSLSGWRYSPGAGAARLEAGAHLFLLGAPDYREASERSIWQTINISSDRVFGSDFQTGNCRGCGRGARLGGPVGDREEGRIVISVSGVNSPLLSAIRIVTGLLFFHHGAEKLWGFAGGQIEHRFLTLRGFAGPLDVVGGTLIVFGPGPSHHKFLVCSRVRLKEK